MSSQDTEGPRDWKERFESLRFISETQRSLREQRQKEQMQGFFTTVAFYGIIGAAKFTGRLQLPEKHHVIFVIGAWALLFTVALLSSVYLEGLHASNCVNRQLAQDAENEIMKILGLAGPKKTGRMIAKTRFWQMAVIWLLACSVGVSLTYL